VIIHEKGNVKNKLLTVRMKIEKVPTKKNPDAIYIRNYIEKGPLLEKLTEYRKASWDDARAVQSLDRVTQQRSTVKAAPNPEKLGTAKSLGRQRQR
jgi:hypothetical protein